MPRRRASSPLHGGARPPTSRIARSRRRADGGPARDPRHQHRRDVAHRARRRRRSSTPGCTRSRATTRRAAIDTLDTERIVAGAAPISAPAAPRASGPGRARRLWDRARSAAPAARAGHRAHRSRRAAARPAAWGGDPDDVRLVRGAAGRGASPRRARCCERLGALDGGALTPLGRRMQRAAAASAARPHPDRGAAAPATRRAPARSCSPSASSLPAAPRGDDVRSARRRSTRGRSLPPHVHQVARAARGRSAGARRSGTPRRAARVAEADAAARALRRLRRSPGAAPRARRATTLVLATGHRRRRSAARAACATASSWSRSTSRRPTARRAIRTRCVRIASRVEPRVDRRRPRSPSSTPSTPRTGRVRAWRRERVRRARARASIAQAPEPEPPRRGCWREAWLARGAGRGRRRLRSAASAFAGLDVDRARAASGRRRAASRRSTTIDLARARAARRCRASSTALAPDAPARAERAARGARLRGGRHRRGVGQAAGAVRAGRDAAHRAVGARRWSCRCSRRTAGRCRPRAICAASGIARIRRCGRSCAAAIRGTRGPTIPGRRRRPRAPSRGREALAPAAAPSRGSPSARYTRALQTPARPID